MLSQEELKTEILTAIVEIAPDVEVEDVDPDEDLREACDLDSMDFLNIIITLKMNLGVVIAESDYSKVNTLNKMRDYLAHRLG